MRSSWHPAAPVLKPVDAIAALWDSGADLLLFLTHGHTARPETAARSGVDPSDFLKVIDALPRAQRGKGWEGAYTRIKADELEADESWIELRRGRITLLDLAELPTRSLARGPLVILNMCESAQVVPTLAGGFVDAFMGAGAVAVIGTETSVPPTFAHPFVLRVLASFLGGAPIGTALLDARNAYSRQGGGRVGSWRGGVERR